MLSKDKFEGKVVGEWKAALSKYEPKPEELDVSTGVGSILAVKDDEEAVSGHKLAKLVWRQLLIRRYQ